MDDLEPTAASNGDAALPDWTRADPSTEEDLIVEELVIEEVEVSGEDVLVEETIIEVIAEADASDLADAELIDVISIDGEGGDEGGDPAEPSLSPYDLPGDWFVVHTYAGYENKVKQNLASRVRSMNVEG